MRCVNGSFEKATALRAKATLTRRIEEYLDIAGADGTVGAGA
jgi:hypothetical protein